MSISRPDPAELLRRLDGEPADAIESQFVEFKSWNQGRANTRSQLKEVRETVVAFANAAGGVLILGVADGKQTRADAIHGAPNVDLTRLAGEIYNGADDNASGSAALLALASYLASNPPRYSHLFVAFDAEELGLRGARAFVSDPPVPLSSILLNVNLDMIGHSEAGELYAAGPHHYPALVPLVEAAASRARLTLRIGHDSPELSARDDWTELSDHAAFHARGVPFVYFGVEDHEDYHRPTDTVESLTLDFYMDAVEAILDFLLIVDREAEQLG